MHDMKLSACDGSCFLIGNSCSTPRRSSLLSLAFTFFFFYKNMDELKQQFSDDAYDNDYLTEEQESLVDKLILDKKLVKTTTKKHHLYKKCKQPKSNHYWCQCFTKHFQQNFKNWISEIQVYLKNAIESSNQAMEWIEHDRFENIGYLVKGGFCS